MVFINRALRFGILWGLIAVLLAVFLYFLRPILGFVLDILDQVGLNLAWFAVMMAGVHYGARSGYRGWLASIFGGGISGLIAAIFLIIVSLVLPAILSAAGTALTASSGVIVLGVAFLVGMFGGFSGEFIDRRG